MESNIAGLYDLDRVLGKGHYGIVRLAKHVLTGQQVAVKVIDKTKLDRCETEHLLKEVQCMKLVRHPNVVRLYQVISTRNKLYLVLELGLGGDLHDYLHRMPHGLGEDRSRMYFCQIIRAIAYCHHLHIVHRDLKPENIIFNEDYSVLKLTDFGFSNEFLPGQMLNTYCGSVKYSAPEILLQDAYDPPAVDVWSLGVVLFQMVAGRLPFSEVNDSETVTKILDGIYEIPDEFSESLKNLLSKMLVVDPQGRITVKEIIKHPWAQCPQDPAGSSLYIPINGLLNEVGITAEENERVTQIMLENNIATKEVLDSSLALNSYDYVSATYRLLAEQLKQKRLKYNSVPIIAPEPPIPEAPRRGSVPEVNSELLKEIRSSGWNLKETPEKSPRTQRRGRRSRPYTSGSSCSSEDDGNISPTIPNDRYCRDEDTFFEGKPKPSPKRTTRCNLASLNIHAVTSSSEESDDEDLSKPLFEPPRSKQLTRLFRKITPPTGGIVDSIIEEGSEDGENESPDREIMGTKSQPTTLRKRRSPLCPSSSLDPVPSSSRQHVTYAEEAVDLVSPLSTPLCVQRRRDNSSNHSSFSSSVELSSDESDMDLGRRKKLQKHQRGGNRAVASSGGVGRVVSSGSGGDTKRHNNMTCRKGNNNVMTIVQEKLKHIELDFRHSEGNSSSVSS